MNKPKLELIQKLVGPITEDQLKFVDSYVSDTLGIFIPSVGQCGYAVIPEHTHPAYSFILTIDKAENNPSLSKLNLKNSDKFIIAAIAPNKPHEEEMDDEFSRYFAIFVKVDFFLEAYSIYSEEKPADYFWDQFQIDDTILVTIKEFMAECNNKLPGAEVLMNTLATKIVHMIIRTILNIHSDQTEITDRIEIAKAIEYIQRHFGKKILLEELAGICAMSTSTFSRIFKKETKVTPMDFIMKVRLDKAKKFITSGEKNLSEIAIECGFNSSSHFSSAFSKLFGVSPLSFKKKYFSS